MYQKTLLAVPTQSVISEFNDEIDQAFQQLSEELRKQQQLLDGEQSV